MKKVLILTMDELLAVVRGETLQLDSWGKEKAVITISKKVECESGEEIILATVIRENKND